MSSKPSEWQEKIEALRNDYSSLQSSASMSDMTREVGDVATEIAGLPGKIGEVRQRGYAFAGYLENKANVLAEQWEQVRQQVSQAVRRETDHVQKEIDEIEDMWRQFDAQKMMLAQERFYNQIRGAMDRLSNAVDASRDRIRGMFGQVPDNVWQTQSQLNQIQGYMKLADEATIKWNPTEALFLVCEAEWAQSGKDKEDPDGLIYVTDQRLIFEQKEKVGSRLGFGGKKVQEVLWDVPLGTITEVTAEDKGFFGQKDMVHLKLSSGDYAEMTLEVKGVDCKWAVQQLNRAITGEIEKERAIPVDEKAAAAVSAAPTACTTCGATLPPITRGMTEIRCDYCGTVMRI